MKIKKPNFWDSTKPNILSYLLLPFTLPIVINNFLLNKKKKIKKESQIKKICIGNIYIGGTSKTPLTIKIYKILNELKVKTVTIKKFYKGHIDEQKMLNNKTKLFCYKSRNLALKKAIKDGADIAIFDDGLQDHNVSYDLSFVCFNNDKWIGNGFLIPAGPLREKIESISKYDAIFLNGHNSKNYNLKKIIYKHNPSIKIFETFYRPININDFSTSSKYIIFSGIGNPESFKNLLSKNNINITKAINFPDHHNYTTRDINKIKLMAQKLEAKIITTEKDFIKLDSYNSTDIEFLKVDLIIKNENELTEFILSKL